MTGGPNLTQKFANEHHKPCLHLDLDQIPYYNAVFLVRKWMYENNVEVLNVAGSLASKDPLIFQKVFDIINGVYWTHKIKGQNQESENRDLSLSPRTVDEAVDRIIADFSLRDKVETANLNEEDLSILKAVLAKYVGEKVDE